MKVRHNQAGLFALALLSAVLIYLFYFKYVPLVGPFQAVLIPILVFLTLATAVSLEAGTLVLVFSLPLVNNLPYFFGIDEKIPHAPVALVLAIFYFWAWLAHRVLKRAGGIPPGVKYPPAPLRGPMAFAAGLVAVSMIFTFLRYGNFYPFLLRGPFELVTNTNGVTSGGAQMSVLFSGLSYLSEFAFFSVVFGVLQRMKDLEKALTFAGAGFLASMCFGLYQHFGNPLLGNTRFWAGMGQINATFKDPNAFGACLALASPLFLGAALHFRGPRRILFAAVFAGALVLIPFIGARSGLLGLSISAAVFVAFWAGTILRASRGEGRAGPKPAVWGAGAVLLTAAIVLGALAARNSRVFERLGANVRSLREGGKLVSLSPERYFLWKEALRMTEEFPLTGVGAGAFIIELPNYYAEDQTRYEAGFEGWRRNDSAENYFLQVSSELGAAGLILFLWIFAGVGKLAVSGPGARRGLETKPFLYWGAAAGVISYLVSILFHSYIGSFETKFFFWFLVSIMILAVPGNIPAGGDAPRNRSSCRLKTVLALALLASFGCVHLWNSTHSLSLAERTKRYGLRQDFGFYPAEKTADGREFRWSRAYGGTALRIEKPVLEISMTASHPDLEMNPVRVRVTLEKAFFRERRILDEIEIIRNEWKSYSFGVSDEVGRDVILLFEVSRTWSPLKAKVAPDPRDLGIALGEIRFR